MIAEQVSNFAAHVEWITADPVTGSSMRLHQSGVFYDDETKQLEPLGQEVLAVEPPVVEEPDPNDASSAVTHSAGEPEWQCRAAAAAGNNFWQQPVHCQQAQIQNLNFSLEGLLSAHTENNPLRMTQPLTTTATLGTAINLRPTIKPDGSANVSGSAVVPSTSQPGDGSEETTLINSGGTAENSYVTVGISFGNSHGPSLDERFVSAESSGQRKFEYPTYSTKGFNNLNDGEKKRFTDAYVTLTNFVLQNEQCVKFLGGYEKVRNALAKARYKFNYVMLLIGDDSPGGPRSSKTYYDGAQDGKNITINLQGTFMIKNGIVQAQIGANKNNGAVSNFKSLHRINFDMDKGYAAFILLHELAHLTGAIEDNDGEFTEKETSNNAKLEENCLSQPKK